MMADADRVATASDRLLELVGRLERHEGFAEVVESLKAGHAATLDGVWGSSCALAAAALAAQAPRGLVVVCPTVDQVDDLVDDLALFTRLRPERFPAWESLEEALNDETFGQRVRLLKMLKEGGQARLLASHLNGTLEHSQETDPNKRACPPFVLVASVQSLMQPVPGRETLERQTRVLRVGQSGTIADLTRWLAENGLVATPAVELPGEFSIRGGIVDVFASDWNYPVRIEYFGDEIESIRQFEIASQRSLRSLESVDVTIVGAGLADRAHLADYLPPDSWFLLMEPMELEHQGRQCIERGEGRGERGENTLHTVSDVLRRVLQFPSVTASAVATASFETTCRLKVESVERFSGDINRVRGELDEAGTGQEVFVVCQTEAEVRRLHDIFQATRTAREGRLHFPIGTLQSGFRLVPDRIVLLSSGELFRRTDLRRPSRSAA